MFAKQLFDNYYKYKEDTFFKRRTKHKDILPLINKHNSYFDIIKPGESYEKREIFCLTIGTGKTKVLLWSQMHGNESTATQSLFDIFNFFSKPEDLQKESDNILNNCTLYFIPMLNPDGAYKFQRENAQGIDINRDALRLESSESKILMNLRDEIDADFGFNLHDQDIWYSAGDSKYPATISFLAPAYNYEKDINETRKKSIQLIVSMSNILQDFIPRQIAKYDDTFMPNAFGDNIQKRGTSTILIESGGYKNDIEKQFVRKLNFICILGALKSISNKFYKKESISDYYKIPFNKKNNLFDFILRKVLIKGKFGIYRADIGIRHKPLPENDFYFIDFIGDLSQNFGFKEHNVNYKNEIIASLNDNADAIISRFF